MFIPKGKISIAQEFAESSLSVSRGANTPVNVALPHQSLYGCMPQLSEQALAVLTYEDLKISGQLNALQEKLSVFKSFLSGVNAHSLCDEQLDKVLSSEVGSVEQAVNLKVCHDTALEKINLQLDEYSRFITTLLESKGLVIEGAIQDFITNTFSLELSSTLYEGSPYSDYSDSEEALLLTFDSGLAVADIDLSDVPKQLRDLTVIFIHSLSAIGQYSTSSDLMYSLTHEEELIDYCAALTKEERNRLSKLVYDDERIISELESNHSELISEYAEVYGDLEVLIFSLRDVLELNFACNSRNAFSHFENDIVKNRFVSILNQINRWRETQNPIVGHSLCNKLNLLASVVLTEYNFDLMCDLNICTDANVADLRIVSYDFKGDEAAIQSISQYHNDMCEDAALAVDLNKTQTIEALKQMRFVDVVLGFLVS